MRSKKNARKTKRIRGGSAAANNNPEAVMKRYEEVLEQRAQAITNKDQAKIARLDIEVQHHLQARNDMMKAYPEHPSVIALKQEQNKLTQNFDKKLDEKRKARLEEARRLKGNGSLTPKESRRLNPYGWFIKSSV